MTSPDTSIVPAVFDTRPLEDALARATLPWSVIEGLPRDAVISCGTMLVMAERAVERQARSMVASAQHAAHAARERFPIVPAANLAGTPIIDAIGELNGLRAGMLAMATALTAKAGA
jgi:hypothetical protein